MVSDLGTTNTWLAVMAIVSVLEFLMLVGIGFSVYRLYRRVAVSLDRLAQQHLVPLSEHAHAVFENIEDVTARARRIEDTLRERLDRIDGAVATAKTVVRGQIAPVLGIVQGVRAGLGSLFEKRASNGLRAS
jgi:hypothetical protein